MKKLLYIFTLLFSFAIYSQGNLQFNKVINITLNVPGGTASNLDGITVYSAGSYTIPDGKVWKIESASLSRYASSSSLNPTGEATQGAIKLGDMVIHASNNDTGGTRKPVWMPSGTYNMSISKNGSNQAGVSISIIEFNIVL